MQDITEVCLCLAAIQLLLLAVVLVRDHSHDSSARASLFLIATVVTHLLVPVLRAHQATEAVLQVAMLVEALVPYAFWLLAEAHFDDDFRLRPRHVLVLAALVAVGGLPEVVPAVRYALWPLVPRLLSLTLMGYALVTVHLGGRSDLIVSRLQARNTVLVLSGMYIFLELLAEVFFSSVLSPEATARIHAVTSLGLVFAVCAICLRLKPEVLRPMRPVPEPALDPALAERLQHLLEVAQVFREEGLTIAVLAERLAVHEYKVRQLINARLGFKNFNAFLHHYRIAEARKVLGDPARAHLGVAQVAYEVGYRSLGPFNKAFKEITGQTPTEFRASRPGLAVALAPSESS